MAMKWGIIIFLVIAFAASAQAEEEAKPRIVLLANDIDYELAQDFFGFLGNKGMEVTRVTAENFEANKKEKFIVILGGPDAYDGVGEIVRQALSEEEEEYLRAKGNRKMYVKTNVWHKGQVVHVIAGSDRNETKKAHEEEREKLDRNVKGAVANQVKIQGFAFIPATILVEEGAIVTWTNRDAAAHTATRSGDFDSGRLEKGDSWSTVLNTVGTLEYRCSYHPYMRGTIIVQPAKSR
jgi:plastocyanin